MESCRSRRSKGARPGCAGPPAQSEPVAEPIAPLPHGDVAAPPAALALAASRLAAGIAVSTHPVLPAAPHHRRSSTRSLLGEINGHAVEIVLDAVPSVPGHVFVRAQDATEITEAAARDVVLVGFEAAGRN